MISGCSAGECGTRSHPDQLSGFPRRSGELDRGAKAHAHKIELSRAIRKHKIAFTVNLVVHRQNLDHLEEMIAFIETIESGPGRDCPRAVLRMGARQSCRADANARATGKGGRDRCRGREAARRTHAHRLRVPDYYAKYPKACMGGWGQRLMLVNPSGKVLPCHAAEVLPD